MMTIENKFEIGQKVYSKHSVIKHIKEGVKLYPLTIEAIVVCVDAGIEGMGKTSISYRLVGLTTLNEQVLVPATEDSINEIKKEILEEEISKKKEELEKLEKKLEEIE